PRTIAREALQKHRYGDHPATREVPQAEDVAVVTPEQVRALHQASVLPRGSVLVLVGDLDPSGVIGDLEKVLGGWASDRSAVRLETRYELGRLGQVPPAGDELESVRQYAIGSLLTSTSSQGGLAGQVLALASTGLGLEWLNEHPARVAAVTADEVAEAALKF